MGQHSVDRPPSLITFIKTKQIENKQMMQKCHRETLAVPQMLIHQMSDPKQKPFTHGVE